MRRFPGNMFSNPPWRVSLDDELHKYVERKTMETPVAVRTFFWESLLPHIFVLQEIFDFLVIAVDVTFVSNLCWTLFLGRHFGFSHDLMYELTLSDLLEGQTSVRFFFSWNWACHTEGIVSFVSSTRHVHATCCVVRDDLALMAGCACFMFFIPSAEPAYFLLFNVSLAYLHLLFKHKTRMKIDNRKAKTLLQQLLIVCTECKECDMDVFGSAYRLIYMDKT